MYSAKGAVVWSLATVLLVCGAFELAALFDFWPEPTNEAPTEEGDFGTVVLKTEGNRCERIEYDKQGYLIASPRACSNSDLKLDEQGRPLPSGTMRRLDAIGNSFLRRN